MRGFTGFPSFVHFFKHTLEIATNIKNTLRAQSKSLRGESKSRRGEIKITPLRPELIAMLPPFDSCVQHALEFDIAPHCEHKIANLFETPQIRAQMAHR